LVEGGNEDSKKSKRKGGKARYLIFRGPKPGKAGGRTFHDLQGKARSRKSSPKR